MSSSNLLSSSSWWTEFVDNGIFYWLINKFKHLLPCIREVTRSVEVSISCSLLQDALYRKNWEGQKGFLSKKEDIYFPLVEYFGDVSKGMLLLPTTNDEDCNEHRPVSPRQALRVALNLKKLVDTITPQAVAADKIKSFDLDIKKEETIQAVYDAAGGDINDNGYESKRRYQACLVFCLLKVSGWFDSLAESRLERSDLYTSRSLVAQTIACILIDREKEDKYLFLSMLCHRYSINLNNEDSDPENALELAVDTRSPIVATSGYQRCIKWLWNGWIVQSRHDPSEYVLYKGIANMSFWAHFKPDRIQTPLYQNALEIFVAIVFLIIYTIVTNRDAAANKLNIPEILLFFFTFGFLADEIQKLYHIGSAYLQLGSTFNDILYTIIFISFGFRFAAVTTTVPGHDQLYDTTSHRFLAVAAPFMWIRMLFFCDIYHFFGVMIVVVNTMMKESIIFFFMLSVVIIGFLQAFIGLDQADGKRDLTYFIITNMLNTVLSGPDFSAIERFAYPYGSVLYYIYNFLVTVILLNILIALFSSAYSDVISNANNEYLFQYSSRVLKYIRAPDAKIFLPPFNLIEIFLLDIPFAWWMNERQFNSMCNNILFLIYSPVLLITSNYEVRESKRVSYNRSFNHADDANEEDQEWLLTDGYDETIDDADNRHQIERNIDLQMEAENAEPGFVKGFPDWNRKLKTLAPPMKEAGDQGVSPEAFKILSYIDVLSQKVDTLIENNKSLQRELDSHKSKAK